MDRLYQRYADPFSFIRGMIQTCRFCDFVEKFDAAIRKEREDKLNWEFFLHKVWDGSYQDFLSDVEINKQNMNMSKETLEATVNHSMNILNNFNPDKRG